jgi:Transposase DDE domain
MHRNPRAGVRQQRRVGEQARHSDACAFFNLLTGGELLDEVEALLPEHRERLFPPSETLSMFLAQALDADRSCQKAVNTAALHRLASALPACSTHTGAYCRARGRLPTPMLRTLARSAGQRVVGRAARSWHWRKRPVRLVDGTTVTLPDTPANQGAYPQSHNQKPGLGFPLCRIVGIVCLGSGGLLDAAIGPYQGKGSDEQSLLRSMLDTLARGDVLVGDAFYATYFLLCTLLERGIDAVFEQHGSRQRVTDFRRGQRLGQRDHLIVLQKPLIKPDWMSEAAYAQAPESLSVRELRTGGKTLITTLLCPKQTSKAELKLLYRDRWHVELDLRNIKTTLGMEHLSCLHPSMAVKEIWVYLLAYNLIRMMMVQAARHTQRLPRQLSFKHAVQICIVLPQHRELILREDKRAILFELIAQQRVGDRPGRIEPRAAKRRPKTYPLLMQPRAIARAEIRKYGHPAKLK